MKLPTERKLDEIRGKMSVNAATQEEVMQFMFYVSKLESLVEEASIEDFWGTEGWRHYIGLE